MSEFPLLIRDVQGFVCNLEQYTFLCPLLFHSLPSLLKCTLKQRIESFCPLNLDGVARDWHNYQFSLRHMRFDEVALVRSYKVILVPGHDEDFWNRCRYLSKLSRADMVGHGCTHL